MTNFGQSDRGLASFGRCANLIPATLTFGEPMKKIFVVGPGRCGTTSLHKFFLANKIASIHHHDEHGNLADRIISNASAGLDPLSALESYTAFSDMHSRTGGLYVTPLLTRKVLLEAYPEEIYILNTRNFDAWMKSRKNHRKGSASQSGMDRVSAISGGRYSAQTEYETYLSLADNPPASFHIFDLDNDAKFEELSVFLEQNAFPIVSRDVRYENKTVDGPMPNSFGNIKRHVKKLHRRLTEPMH